VLFGAEMVVNEPTALAGALAHGGLVLAEVVAEPERSEPL
jgi:hypothetical protein